MSVWRPVLNLIAASTLAGSSWFIAAPFPAFTFAAAPSSGSAGVDPAQAAREVLLDQDFWWKRVEPRSVSTSWLDATLEAVWNFLREPCGRSGNGCAICFATSAACSRAIRLPSRP